MTRPTPGDETEIRFQRIIAADPSLRALAARARAAGFPASSTLVCLLAALVAGMATDPSLATVVAVTALVLLGAVGALTAIGNLEAAATVLRGARWTLVALVVTAALATGPVGPDTSSSEWTPWPGARDGSSAPRPASGIGAPRGRTGVAASRADSGVQRGTRAGAGTGIGTGAGTDPGTGTDSDASPANR